MNQWRWWWWSAFDWKCCNKLSSHSILKCLRTKNEQWPLASDRNIRNSWTATGIGDNGNSVHFYHPQFVHIMQIPKDGGLSCQHRKGFILRANWKMNRWRKHYLHLFRSEVNKQSVQRTLNVEWKNGQKDNGTQPYPYQSPKTCILRK